MSRASANQFAFDLPNPDAPELFDSPPEPIDPVLIHGHSIDTIRAAIAKTLAMLEGCETNPWPKPEDPLDADELYYRGLFHEMAKWLRGAEKAETIAAFNAQAARLGFGPIEE